MGDFKTHLDHSANVRVCRPVLILSEISSFDKYVWLRNSRTKDDTEAVEDYHQYRLNFVYKGF